MLKKYFRFNYDARGADNKIYYLEGLRAIASIIVVIHHFLLIFYPNLERRFLNDGHLAVMIFMLLTGIVTSLKLYGQESKNIGFVKAKIVLLTNYIIRRYLRLFPLIFVSIVISWFLLTNNMYCIDDFASTLNIESLTKYFSETNISIARVGYDVLYGAYTNGSDLNSPLWTISYEFFGAIIVFGLALMLVRSKYRFIIYMLILAIVDKVCADEYFTSLLIGMVLSDWFYNPSEQVKIIEIFKECLNNKFIKYICAVAIVYIYFIRMQGSNSLFYRNIVASGVLFLVLSTEKLQTVLSNKILGNIANVSFEIYVLHWPIMCSLSCCMMMFALEKQYNYYISSLIVFAISLVCIFICAYLVNRILTIIGRIVNDKTILLIDKSR